MELSRLKSRQWLEDEEENILEYLHILRPPSPPSHSSVELSRPTVSQSSAVSRQRDTEKPFLATILGEGGR